jgi:hypothetical protein
MSSRSLKLPTGYAVAVSRSERLVAAVGRNVVVADLATGKRVFSAHPFAHPSHVAFSADESRLAVKNTGGAIAILCTQSGATSCLHKPAFHDEGAAPVFSADGEFLVDPSWAGVITVRRSDTLAPAASFAYDNEQVGAASASEARDKWLFVHSPRWSKPGNVGLPYLTLWNWPLTEVESKITPGFDTVYAAALAPTAPYLAVVGYERRIERQELRIIGLDGELISSAPVSGGGTGFSTRWSRDSKLTGTIGRKSYRVFSAPELADIASIPEEYPSDLSFFADGRQVVLGSWTKTTKATIPGREA